MIRIRPLDIVAACALGLCLAGDLAMAHEDKVAAMSARTAAVAPIDAPRQSVLVRSIHTGLRPQAYALAQFTLPPASWKIEGCTSLRPTCD